MTRPPFTDEIMGTIEAFVARAPTKAQKWTPSFAGSDRVDRDSVRAQDRHALGVFAHGNGLWFGNDLLAASAGLADRRNQETAAPNAVG